MAYAPPTLTHNTRAYNSILLERPLTTGEMRANVSWRARRWAGLTPKRIPFFEPYAWLARDVFHSLPGASPCIHATWAISSRHDASLVSR